MSDQVFMLPDLGEGLADAEVVEWRVAVGDAVTIDQVIVEVETAKASVEVPVPFEGTVTQLHGAVGDVLIVGKPLITVFGTTDAPDTAAEAAQQQYRQEELAGSGNVLIGYGTSESPKRRRRRTEGPSRKPDPASVTSEDSTIATAAGATRVISPVVRALALQNGIALDTLSTASKSGIITRADVTHAIEEQASSDADTPEKNDARDDVRIAITGLRRIVAEKMSTSRREIPEATTWVDVDATNLMESRRAINASSGESSVSLMALLARLTVAALSQYPQLNATVDTEAQEIVQYGHVNLGIAAQTPRGLVVPVLAQADTRTTLEMAAELRSTTALAREGKLPPRRLTGGTFTLNNYGVFGVDGSAAIINHPEVAILGIGRIMDKPWVVAGELAVRKVTQISLAFDHRVCDGGVAGGFLRLFADYVENPVAALGRL